MGQTAETRQAEYLQASKWGGEKPVWAELHKLVWCARHGIDVRQVPRDYSFREVNGVVLVETFSDRMSNTRKQLAKQVKVRREDYDFIERFAHIAKEIIDEVPDAKVDLFALLNGKRDEFIRYARTASGGVSQKKAIDYADKAIIKVYDTVLTGTFAVASPIASIKWHINHFIKTNRKKRRYEKETGD